MAGKSINEARGLMEGLESNTIEIESDDIILRGTLWSPLERGVPLVVLCHGIPMGRPQPADGGYSMLAKRILELGYASVFFNFRGTGESGGNFHLGGWYCDLVSVMEYVRRVLAHRFRPIYLIGFSTGGALAVRYAAEHGGIAGVAALAPPADFTTVFPPEHLDFYIDGAKEIGIIRDPGFPPSREVFYRELEQCNAIEYVSGVSPIPLLIVHGDCDEMVPPEHGTTLFRAAGEPCELKILPGGHHRLRHDPRSLEAVIDWLERLESRRSDKDQAVAK